MYIICYISHRSCTELFSLTLVQGTAKCWSRLHTILVLYRHDSTPFNPDKNNIKWTSFSHLQAITICIPDNMKMKNVCDAYKYTSNWTSFEYTCINHYISIDINSSMHWLTCNGYDHCFGSGYIWAQQGGGEDIISINIQCHHTFPLECVYMYV